MAAGQPVQQPFLRAGLYAHSRLPNYLCEIGIWWVFYLFAVAASGQWLHWSALGFLLLTLLMAASTRFGESISLAKYPAYADYQGTTPRLTPFLRVRHGQS